VLQLNRIVHKIFLHMKPRFQPFLHDIVQKMTFNSVFKYMVAAEYNSVFHTCHKVEASNRDSRNVMGPSVKLWMWCLKTALTLSSASGSASCSESTYSRVGKKATFLFEVLFVPLKRNLMMKYYITQETFLISISCGAWLVCGKYQVHFLAVFHGIRQY
jgi:hypothetical protein